jgi:diguanylate cyclase (GGDEF)-like protein
VSVRVGLRWAMGLLLVAYAIGLAVPSTRASAFTDLWLGQLTAWVPAVLCWFAVKRVGRGHPETVLASIAVTCFAAGNSYYVARAAADGAVPFPSPADVGYLGFYPCTLAALVVVVRHRWRRHARSVWLDGVVGALGAASLLAVLLSPALVWALTGSSATVSVVAAAYPLFDLLLVAAVMGVASLGAGSDGSRWWLMIVGLAVFAATDVVYAVQIADASYLVGAPIDAGWALGLAFVALWVDDVARLRGDGPDAVPATRGQLLVSSLATAAALGVLLVGTRIHVSTPAVALAAATLLVAALRTQASFRTVRRIAELRREAGTDDLTGLPNRRALYGAGDGLAAQPSRPRALLLLDLDRFKDVNDSLGHHAGDRLLVEVGARLRARLDGRGILARLGGDEFAVLLDDCGRPGAEATAEALAEALAAPFVVDGMVLVSTASIGIALYPDDGEDLATLMRKADIAMYKAKASGVGHHTYGGSDDAESATRLQTVRELQGAIAAGELVLHYQPKVELATGQVRSVEALVRWQHPTRGLLYPDAFLHLVERGGLMPGLTTAVLARALDQVAAWRSAGCAVAVAVNLSASSLIDEHLPDRVAALLAERGVPPCALQLEVTEGLVMANRRRAHAILVRLRELGVQVSVDDFGTGYSSLSYLRDLPVDEIKLDRTFITPMPDDARATALVSSTIALAHGLGLRIVAEGVETQETYDVLARLGCDEAQGYLLSRPVPAAQLERWLRDRSQVSAGV